MDTFVFLTVLISVIQYFYVTISAQYTITDVHTFPEGNRTQLNYYKIFVIDKNSMLVGAKNAVYNISLSNLQEVKSILWPPTSDTRDSCSEMFVQPGNHCENYIRVIIQKSPSEYLICGTNAYSPTCHIYISNSSGYHIQRRFSGTFICPYNQYQNSTSILADDHIYTGTVSDKMGRDAVIYREPLRSIDKSNILNDPQFVGSFEYHERVFYFFREVAIENVNCGKAVFSRVASVCKNDGGGGRFVLENKWTSLLKSRLDCSIPGEYPFYFNEIQSTSIIGGGNIYPTLSVDNYTDIIYAVFSTGNNGLRGSAVCAFKMSDIYHTFEGPFKEQPTPDHAWRPVDNLPFTHTGGKCNSSTNQNEEYSSNIGKDMFMKDHALMHLVVPSFGGKPMTIREQQSSQLTAIAIDWHVLAADKKYYDVIYTGTEDGRVLKTVNVILDDGTLRSDVVEEMEVFHSKQPVTDIKVFHSQLDINQHRLIVVSNEEIKSIPLYRCEQYTSCRSCVFARDPYCSWTNEKKCDISTHGIQNVTSGRSWVCQSAHETTQRTTPPPPSFPSSTLPSCPPCVCPTITSTSTIQSVISSTEKQVKVDGNGTKGNVNMVRPPAPPSASRECASPQTLNNDSAIAITAIVSIIISLLIGFAVGFFVNKKRNDRYMDRKFRQDLTKIIPDNPTNYNNHRGQYHQPKTNNQLVDASRQSKYPDSFMQSGEPKVFIKHNTESTSTDPYDTITRGKKVYV